MSFFKNRPIPLLDAGPERELMAFLLRRGVLHARESKSPRITEPP